MEHFTPLTHTLSHADIPFKNLIWTRLGVSVTRKRVQIPPLCL